MENLRRGPGRSQSDWLNEGMVRGGIVEEDLCGTEKNFRDEKSWEWRPLYYYTNSPRTIWKRFFSRQITGIDFDRDSPVQKSKWILKTSHFNLFILQMVKLRPQMVENPIYLEERNEIRHLVPSKGSQPYFSLRSPSKDDSSPSLLVSYYISLMPKGVVVVFGCKFLGTPRMVSQSLCPLLVNLSKIMPIYLQNGRSGQIMNGHAVCTSQDTWFWSPGAALLWKTWAHGSPPVRCHGNSTHWAQLPLSTQPRGMPSRENFSKRRHSMHIPVPATEVSPAEAGPLGAETSHPMNLASIPNPQHWQQWEPCVELIC